MRKPAALIPVLGLALLALLAPAASAQTPHDPTPQKQHRLTPAKALRGFRMRIAHGVKTHQITSDERANLRLEIAELRARLRADRQDGTPRTREERAALKAALKRINRDIYRARHGGK